MASMTAAPTDSRDPAHAETLRMSYDEYLMWCEKEAGRRGEWVDGEVIVFMATTERHERLLTFLVTMLNIVLRRRRLGWVYGSGYELQTGKGTAREPDLLVVLNEHRDRITERRLVGAADIVVEIISSDSVVRDRRDKLAEYAAAGVPEYWIVDPREGRERFDMFAQDDQGNLLPVQRDSQGRTWSSILPGVWFEAAWLLGDELPDEVELGLLMAGTRIGQTTS